MLSALFVALLDSRSDLALLSALHPVLLTIQ